MSAQAEPIVDAEIVTEEQPPTEPVGHVGQALVTRERRSEVLRPLNADDLVESFHAYQDLLPKLLDANDYQEAGRGKRFVKKSGWRKIATAFDLDVTLIRSTVERDENGQPLRAEVWARAVAPTGRTMDGDGYCDISEERFSGPRGNKSKLENDLRGTATTRAMNRAISGLVGMGDVSAEEVDQPAAQGPPFGAAVVDNVAASNALIELVGDLAPDVWGQIKMQLGGYMPDCVARALVVVAESSKAA